MNNLPELKFTGERLVTQVNNHYGTIEHLHRYAIALHFCKNKTVLDIASGEGYGTNLLSSVAEQVYGVDISEVAIEHAKQKYTQPSVQFKLGSTSNIPLADEMVDVVVTFETIEHHDEHEKMMQEIKRVLKPHGLLIISSPEKEIYTERDPNNSFHIKELTGHEFTGLLKQYFSCCKTFTQRFDAGSTGLFSTYDGTFEHIKQELTWQSFYNKPYFNFAVCSNDAGALNTSMLNASFFSGYNVYEEENKATRQALELLDNRYKKSKAFRIGFFIMKPFYWLKEMLKTK
jgi:ubiquinone/menaquinone biosynthesis C-methylase UbiE